MVELFMTQAVGLPAEFVAPLRASPFFPSMEAVAHALVYDAMIVGDFSLPTLGGSPPSRPHPGD
jgi:hypothetical protein